MSLGTASRDDKPLPLIPDLRQSMCHTLMAAGFVLLNLLNPTVVSDPRGSFHQWMMLALAIVVVLSWYFFSRRLRAWRAVPAEIRARVTRRPRDLKQRAVSHLLMSLLAIGLTSLGTLVHLITSGEEAKSAAEVVLLGLGALVGVAAVAIFAGTVRDIIASRGAAG